MYCEQCRNYSGLDGYCTDVCPQYAFGDKKNKSCVVCDQECRGGCTGSSSSDCNACSNFKIFLNEELTQVSCVMNVMDEEFIRVSSVIHVLGEELTWVTVSVIHVLDEELCQ